jgi:hypothetical protein
VLVSRSGFRIVPGDGRGVIDVGREVQFLSPDAASQRRQIVLHTSTGVQAMKRKELPKGTSRSHASTAGLEKRPNFAEWMTAAAFEDGKGRPAPTITIWCTSGEWRCNLRDKAEGVCLWLSEDTLDKLLKLVEEMCQNPMAPWRVDDPADGRDGKRLPRRG